MCPHRFLLYSALFLLPTVSGKSNVIRIILYKETPYKSVDSFIANVDDYTKTIQLFFGNGSPDVPLGKLDKNVDFSAGIELGYPKKQRFTVNIDTCFSGLWIPSSLCYLSWSCYGKNHYDRKHSVDYINDILNNEQQSRTITYRLDTGSEVKGTLGFDTLWMEEAEIPGVHFMQATDLSYNPFHDVISDGVLGLGFPSVSLKMASPLFTMLDRGVLDSPEFSLFVGRKTLSGEIIFGGRNSFHFIKDSLRFHPLNSTSDWQISVHSVDFRGNELCPLSCEALIDAGTALIAAPEESLKFIYKQLQLDYNGKVMEVDCSLRPRMPLLKITIDKQVFTLNAYNYVVEIGDKKCALGFMESPKESFWILGNVFLSTVYTVFNTGEMKIGFATLNVQ